MRLMSGRGVGECGSGRHSYGGGVISEVGWLSLFGTSLQRLFELIAPCSELKLELELELELELILSR